MKRATNSEGRLTHADALPRHEFTEREYRDQNVVARLNACIDLNKLGRLLKDAEWNRIVALAEKGRLRFSGDPTGFHLVPESGSEDYIIDCNASRVNDKKENS